jgi:hypothetical protein
MPFSHEQFLDVFGDYNRALWPGALLLWMLSVAVGALVVVSPRRRFDDFIVAVLVTHWLWSGALYHGLHFTKINPAAWLFMALFVIEAAALLWLGIRRRITFAAEWSRWRAVGLGFIAYALVYPAIGVAQYFSFTRAPTFGVPCPTTIFTAGLLMLARPRIWQVSVIPVMWSAVGGSAAVLFGVAADFALPIAGLALAVYTLGGDR